MKERSFSPMKEIMNMVKETEKVKPHGKAGVHMKGTGRMVNNMTREKFTM